MNTKKLRKNEISFFSGSHFLRSKLKVGLTGADVNYLRTDWKHLSIQTRAPLLNKKDQGTHAHIHTCALKHPF